MKYVLGILALIAVAVLAIYALGSRLPREHRISRSARLAGPPGPIFKAITDVEGFTQWRPELMSAERLAAAGLKRRYRETSSHGALTFEVTEELDGARLVTTIVDEGQPFGGRWTIELRNLGSATEVTITEDGFVDPAFFRFLSRYVFGHATTMQRYLDNLERRFGVGRPAASS